MQRRPSSSPPSSGFKDLFSRQAAPVFSIFFMWGFGTGALWLVRPLFAYELSGSILLVGLISAATAAPRIVSGPIIGFLTDRWGRRPLIFMGSLGHIAVLVGQFYSQTYIQFFFLELATGLVVTFWNVSSAALVADVTTEGNRGRGVAVRNISNRTGVLAGPVVAGIIAAVFGLRYVFLFIAATKLTVFLITLFLVKETRPELEKREPRARDERGQVLGEKRFDLTMFRNRSFVALSIATFAYGMIGIGPGVFRSFFPVHIQTNAGLGPAEMGYFLAIAGFATMAMALPIGMLLDSHGRKWLLFVGMVVVAISAYGMAITANFPMALVAVAIFGVGEAIAGGSQNTYAIDLAPPNQRGTFLGVWRVSMGTGQFAGPLGIGLVADLFGTTAAFMVMAGILAAAAAVVLVFAVETRGRQTDSSAPTAG